MIFNVRIGVVSERRLTRRAALSMDRMGTLLRVRKIICFEKKKKDKIRKTRNFDWFIEVIMLTSD